MPDQQVQTQAPESDGGTEDAQQLSKNQRKKRARLERHLAKRKERRKAERERKKERRREAARKADGGSEVTQVKRERHKQFTAMSESQCRMRVAVDMAYDELMNVETVRKTISQLSHCYAANRRTPNPVQFYIINVNGKTKEIFDKIPGYRQWDAHIQYEPITDLWDNEEIVYLTADSENVLNELDDQKVYIIGGLLDHNHHKGLCLRRAAKLGYAHAKLPIDSYFRMSTRKVLAINHVFEILVHYTREHDWERAFCAVIPKRKGLEQINSKATTSEEKKDDEVVELTSEEGRNEEVVDLTTNDEASRGGESANADKDGSVECIELYSSKSTIVLDDDDDDDEGEEEGRRKKRRVQDDEADQRELERMVAEIDERDEEAEE